MSYLQKLTVENTSGLVGLLIAENADAFILCLNSYYFT